MTGERSAFLKSALLFLLIFLFYRGKKLFLKKLFTYIYNFISYISTFYFSKYSLKQRVF